jgi:3-methylcrotonyl-CoA carboxylase alpha subunit
MITSLLIANRGEIACRIIRTAQAMGIRTVAVYSDADAKALHVRSADEAVHIGPSPARESYLVVEKIIAAAKATKAEAIHPGYGFLSENAAFAQAVIDAGLIWVGPRPASITAMGLKDAAKTLMAEAGVPVTPGYLGENQNPSFLAAQAAEIGYPVLIKAVAGGGGKGMRKVEAAADFADALASCQREAASSFGNDHVLIEKYIQRPRHIEVQVFGDTHGNIVHLFERDCSLQRRHQKVIEEAPAPGMDEATRQQLCAAAVRAAKAVDYVGAGTIEFIADASEGLRADRIWFMEMNTRLQVEHPVTEEITGVDLVEWQLRVASGEPLPKQQDELSINGWAMEARLYAEDPAKGFLPSVGQLLKFEMSYHGRIDSGVAEGDVISSHYDPMIAKFISHGASRNHAGYHLQEMVQQSQIGPIKHNAYFLAKCLLDEDVSNGNLDTGLIERKAEELTAKPIPDDMEKQVGALNLLSQILSDELHYPLLKSSGQHDWQVHETTKINTLFGFRMNQKPQRKFSVLVDGELDFIEVSEPIIKDRKIDNAVSYSASTSRLNMGFTHEFSFKYRFDNSSATSASDGAILSPMPGRIISVNVAQGDSVTKGQKLLTLEAMKMEHTLTAPFDGVVAELNAEAGAQVQVEALLAKVEAKGHA